MVAFFLEGGKRHERVTVRRRAGTESETALQNTYQDHTYLELDIIFIIQSIIKKDTFGLLYDRCFVLPLARTHCCRYCACGKLFVLVF